MKVVLKKKLRFFLLLVILPAFSLVTFAQSSGNGQYITIPASKKYNKSEKFQKKWGKHYRKEWGTAVQFRIAMLDTLSGGVKPYQAGGGRQSKSLRLKDNNGREYVLRSIDKSFGKALPEITHGSFIEDIANDQVSFGHPYSALTIPLMAKAAKIYYTIPQVYYIPKQTALGEFSEEFGDNLYLFEQRPDENWETAGNFGNAKNIIGTEKMLEKVREDHDFRVDQLMFVRSRLFDMFIGDWGRHEDQWRWAAFKNDNQTLYKPIPRDRDQAYTKFDGKLVKPFLSLAGAGHLQSFDNDIEDMTDYNFPARNLDYRFTNEITKEQWISVAKDLQVLLTDKVINDAIHQMPPEVFSFSGPDLIKTLISRRNNLPDFASDYYTILAKTVQIPGSEDTEFFEVVRSSDSLTEVNVYKINNEGEIKDKPFYHRLFNHNETKEIRIFGMNGEDKYQVKGNVNNAIPVRLIGGPNKDKYTDESVIKSGPDKTIIYDNRNNEIKKTDNTKLKLSSDSTVHEYNYDVIRYNKKSIRPALFYNNEDRIYVALALKSLKHKWRKEPFGSEQYLDVKYSITQNSVSSTYKGHFVDVLGKWDAKLYGNYDPIRWTNFFGLGNNTVLLTKDDDFNRMRSRQFIARAGLVRNIRDRHRIEFAPFFQTIDIIIDTERYIKKYVPLSESMFRMKNFAGATLSYIYQATNDSILPTKGFAFVSSVNHTEGLKNSDASFQTYAAEVNFYIPVTKVLGMYIKGGGSTLTGNPEFYQYNTLGGNDNLRGHERDRFYGNSTLYNQNELRLIWDVRSKYYNGRFGIFGLYDIGRVWLDNETSDIWHSAYGGGIIISPFNRISASAAYAFSKDDNNFHVRLIREFR